MPRVGPTAASDRPMSDRKKKAREITKSDVVVHGPELGARQAAGIGPAGGTRPADVGVGTTESARTASRSRRFLMPEPYRRGRVPQRPPSGFHTRA